MTGGTRPARLAALIGTIAVLGQGLPVAALEIDRLRFRAVTAVVECLFALPCDLGDFGNDGRLTVADVLQAVQIPRAEPSSYTRITVDGDPSINGVFDPSIVFPPDHDEGWMSYSGVDYQRVGDLLVRDVTTRLASTSDGGLSWRMRATLNPPEPITLTVGSLDVCGESQCTGRMISEVSLLVDDGADPDRERRFKLFAHRYFVYPPAADRGQDLRQQLGSINLRTAPALDGPWSDDVALLGWNLTPPEIDAVLNISDLGPVMETCFALSEGGALALDDALDFVFACPHRVGGRIRQRIVLLRSMDHAASFHFVATLLGPEDAVLDGADEFSAPSLLTVAGQDYLIVTPVSGVPGAGGYAGCIVIAFSDRRNGTLERDRAGRAIVRKLLPTEGGRFGGACAWDPRFDATGVLVSQLFFEGSMPSFRVFASGSRVP